MVICFLNVSEMVIFYKDNIVSLRVVSSCYWHEYVYSVTRGKNTDRTTDINRQSGHNPGGGGHDQHKKLYNLVYNLIIQGGATGIQRRECSLNEQ